MDPASILIWITVAGKAIVLGKDLLGLLLRKGGSAEVDARIEYYRRINEALKRRREREQQKENSSNSD